ncbi:MAG: 2-dehydropantoate 2-reductase [Pseudonocardiales bacterium]|nr:2-dehydropantoate 2-reductase [Pseudonocardiales bacterium]
MRYVIIGAGAVGGTIGGRLHEAGHDVVLVARGAHLDALRSDGLRLAEPGRTRTLRIPTAATPADVGWGRDDVAVMATKTQHSAALLDALADVAPDVPVVCAQNGVTNERLAADLFAHVLAICVMLPAEHLEPGLVLSYSAPTPGVLDVGRYPTGADGLAEQISVDLTAAGFSSHADPAIMRWKYRKLVGNLGNAAEAACGYDDPGLRELFAAARDEGERGLAAAGIDVASRAEDKARRGDLIAIHPVDGQARQGGSTWQSLQRGAGSVEAEHLNGEIVRLGRRHGVPTPVNATLLQVVEDMARAGRAPGSYAAVDLLAQARR